MVSDSPESSWQFRILWLLVVTRSCHTFFRSRDLRHLRPAGLGSRTWTAADACALINLEVYPSDCAASRILAFSRGDIPMTAYRVGYLIGSLAKGSLNRKLAKALVNLTPAELSMAEIPFRDLPLYSYDYDADFPPSARAFKDALAGVEAVLFVTPEYNR